MTVVNYLPPPNVSVLRENFRKRLNRVRYRRALEKKWRRLNWFPGLFYYSYRDDPSVPDSCERMRMRLAQNAKNVTP